MWIHPQSLQTVPLIWYGLINSDYIHTSQGCFHTFYLSFFSFFFFLTGHTNGLQNSKGIGCGIVQALNIVSFNILQEVLIVLSWSHQFLTEMVEQQQVTFCFHNSRHCFLSLKSFLYYHVCSLTHNRFIWNGSLLHAGDRKCCNPMKEKNINMHQYSD